MAKAKRPVFIFGNWKMHKTIDAAVQFVKDLIPLVENSSPQIYLAVPFTAIKPVSEEAKESNIVIGAQNMNDASEGAFTGEIAGEMLKNAGAKFVILGHSERRHLFNEDNALINRKVKRAIEDGLQPVVCVGETLEEREEGKTDAVLEEQLSMSLEGLTKEQMGDVIVAYEPVWAIGTGKRPVVEDIEKAHTFCREVLAKKWTKGVANGTPILYGGSVKPENAKELLKPADVDGLLVGGASLESEIFAKIVNYQTEK